MSKDRAHGFSLLEILVAMAIISVVMAWAIPNYVRALRQGEVDRYTQMIEAGFYSLRAQLGTTRTSCTLAFNNPQTWVAPHELLEFRQPNGSLADTERLRCCNSQIHRLKVSDECEDGPLVGDLLGNPASSLRFIRQEGTPESQQVDVAVSSGDYELSPPGTSVRMAPITFIVKSSDADPSNNLQKRCVEVAGSGQLMRGTWKGSLSGGSCEAKTASSLSNP